MALTSPFAVPRESCRLRGPQWEIWGFSNSDIEDIATTAVAEIANVHVEFSCSDLVRRLASCDPIETCRRSLMPLDGSHDPRGYRFGVLKGVPPWRVVADRLLWR